MLEKSKQIYEIERIINISHTWPLEPISGQPIVIISGELQEEKNAQKSRNVTQTKH
jgi:hypothetical protein